MRLRTLELTGFQSYRETETVDFTDVNLAAIIGPNGSGKTSLINAVEFALFGKFRGDVINTIIARGARQATVVLTFALNGTTYRIRRVKTPTVHEAYLAVEDPDTVDGWRVLHEKHPKVVDPYVVNLLGMDHETACTTWLIGQGDVDGFCQLKPAPRRAVLTAAFGLDRYHDLAEQAQARFVRCDTSRAQAQEKLDQLEDRVRTLTEQVNDDYYGPFTDAELVAEQQQLDVEDERLSNALAAQPGDVDALETAHTMARQNLAEVQQAHRRDLDRHRQDQDRAERELRREQAEVDRLAAALTQTTDLAWGLQDATTDLAGCRATATATESELATVRAAVLEHTSIVSTQQARANSAVEHAKEINERIAVLRRTAHGHDGECFACGQALTETRAQSMLAALEQERDDWKTTHDTTLAAARDAQDQVDQLTYRSRALEQQVRRDQRAVTAAAERLRDAEHAQERLGQLRADQENAERARDTAQEAADAQAAVPAPELDTDRVTRLEQAVATTEKEWVEARDAGSNRKRFQEERRQLRVRQKRIWAEQSHREQVTTELAALTTPRASLEQDVAALTRDTTTYRALRDAFRPEGIPAMILAGIVEELNDDANDVLFDLGSTFGVNVTTQREKVTGGVDEKVHVSITTVEGEADYKTLSGSERFRCALAVRIALARCIARRTGTPMETIVLDEGWGVLDEQYRQAVQGVMADLSDDFAVLTVSHIEEIKASFPTVIDVDKQTGTSRTHVRDN